MIDIKDLTPFSAKCLELLLSRFPEFEPFVVPSDVWDHHWYAEIPWPDRREEVGLCARTTFDNLYGEEFRIDIGPQWHDHYGDYSKTGSFEFLDGAFEFINNFINEKYVSVYYWYTPDLAYNRVKDPDFSPSEEDWKNKILAIQVRSWKGSIQKDWKRPKNISTI